MTMLRSRWRYLGVVVLAMIWSLALWRSWGRHPSRPVATPAPVYQAPQAVAKAQVASVAPAAPIALAAAPAAPAPVAAPAASAPVAAPAAAAPVAAPATPAPVAAPAASAPVAASVDDPAAVAEAQTVHDKVWSAVPSVTSDGSRIFVPFSFSQGASGAVDYVWDLWNRGGKRVQRLEFKCQGKGWEYCPHDSVADVAQVRAQELAAATFLAELERKGLHPLQEGVIDQTPTDMDERVSHHASFTAKGDHAPSITFDLSSDGTLTIKPRGHAAITRRTPSAAEIRVPPPSWRWKPTPEQERQMKAELDKGGVPCFNPASLQAPRVDLERRVAVVTIGYRGNDSCWEPSDNYAVVTW